MSIRSKIQALIAAANTKTGESDTTLTDAVQTLVNGYGSGGGWSLPSSISAIDGGSFTVASDTALNSRILSHNLGERPKGFVVWTDNNGESGGSYPVQTILYGLVINSEYLYGTAHNYGFFLEYFRKTNDYPNSVMLGLSEAQKDLALTATTCAFAWRAGEYYKAGVTYKWLAWA